MFPTTLRLSALLLTVESLITFTSCIQLVSTFSQLSVAVATTSNTKKIPFLYCIFSLLHTFVFSSLCPFFFDPPAFRNHVFEPAETWIEDLRERFLNFNGCINCMVKYQNIKTESEGKQSRGIYEFLDPQFSWICP